MTRNELIFALISLNAVAIPALAGVLVSRWAMACYGPMWLAGSTMFVAGATASLGALWIAQWFFGRHQR